MNTRSDAIRAHVSSAFNELVARQEAKMAELDLTLTRLERGWDGQVYLMRDGHGWLATLDEIRDVAAREVVEGAKTC